MKMTFLSLAAAVASIGGASELYVRTGSTISLTCSLRGSSAAAAAAALTPRTPFWFHDGRPVALDSPRGGISLETERTTAGMTSKLLLTKASHQDGGNYTCSPPGAQAAVITVHVLSGEHPAAMQGGAISAATAAASAAPWNGWPALLTTAVVFQLTVSSCSRLH